MKTWLISDTHFGHKNIVEKYGRPEGFEETIFENCTKMIGSEDTLIHLGDVSFKRHAYYHDRMTSFAGENILCRGNHDKKSERWYHDHEWDLIVRLRGIPIYKTDPISNQILGWEYFICFSHIPINIEHFEGYTSINIHGHVHSKGRLEEYKDILTSNHLLVSIEPDAYNLKPVLLDDVLERVKNNGS